MPLPPKQSSDIFLLASQALVGGNNTVPGFNSTNMPAQGGNNTGVRRIPSGRDAVATRNMVRFFVPEAGVVELFVNPQSITYSNKKHITNQRTKGGYLLQYWGEELTQISIQGTTGSSGIEGINVLENVYRSEQLAFDPYALALASDRDAENNDQFSFLGANSLAGVGRSFVDMVSNAIETGAVVSTRAQPTLASLAFSVEMYYSGWCFRGYFTSFEIFEKSDRLGLFDYNLTMMVTQRRGLRTNFLAWHRDPNGPSNSDPIHGRAYSYTSLAEQQSSPTRISNAQAGRTLVESLEDSANFISSIF